MNRFFTSFLIVAFAVGSIVNADIPVQSKERLWAGSTDIAIGMVKGTFTEETKGAHWPRTSGVIEIAVSQQYKGNNLTPGDSVYAWFSTQHWIGKGSPPPSGMGNTFQKKVTKCGCILSGKTGVTTPYSPMDLK